MINCNVMFYEMSNIVKIDLTKFGFSGVTYVQNVPKLYIININRYE